MVEGGEAPHPGHKASLNTALWEEKSKPGIAGYTLRNLIKKQNDLKPFCYENQEENNLTFLPVSKHSIGLALPNLNSSIAHSRAHGDFYAYNRNYSHIRINRLGIQVLLNNNFCDMYSLSMHLPCLPLHGQVS